MKFTIIYLLLFPCFFFSQVWKDNKIGINSNVPKPWAALEIHKSNSSVSVKCWGRTYIFSGKSLIDQIISKGELLLSKPIEFSLNDNKTVWQPGSIKIINQTQNQVTLEINSKTYLNGVKISQNVTADIYYDGLIYFNTKILTDKEISKNIKLELNVNQTLARYINRFANPSSENKASWKSGNYEKDASAYIPYWWIGDTEKGLFWFAESPESWRDYEKKDAIEFNELNNGEAQVVLNFDNENKDVNWGFEFGLQATPIKPIPDRWRERILVGSKDSNINIVWPHYGKPFELKYFGFPEAKNLSSFNRHVEEITTPGKKTLVYNNITFMSDAVPEWQYAKNRWSAEAQDYSADVKAYGDAFIRANLLDKSFHDFIIWKSKEFLDKTKLNGYYVDYSMIGNLNQFKQLRKSDRFHSDMPYYPFMKMRELYERFYKMVKQKNTENLIVTHASARLVPPIIGFSDAYVNGEQFNQQVARVGSEYLDVTNLEAFQSEYSGKAYGIPGIFLPSFSEKNYNVVGPTQSLAALLLVHDISVWPIYSARVVWDEMFDVLKSFPEWQTAEFYSYYSNKKFFYSNNNEVLVSTYKNSKNEYLCIISNISAKDSDAKVTSMLDLDKFNVERKISRGAYHKFGNSVIMTKIMKKDYLVLYLKPKISNE